MDQAHEKDESARCYLQNGETLPACRSQGYRNPLPLRLYSDQEGRNEASNQNSDRGFIPAFSPFVSAAVTAHETQVINTAGACQRHLSALVFSLQEQARLDSQPLYVSSAANGTTLLHYEDSMQRTWCKGGTLHVETEYPTVDNLQVLD